MDIKWSAGRVFQKCCPDESIPFYKGCVYSFFYFYIFVTDDMRYDMMESIYFTVSEIRPNNCRSTEIQTLFSTVNSEVVCFCLPVRAQGDLKRTGGQRLGGSGESWQRLQPVVECGDDAMTLTVRRRRAVQLLLGRGEATASPFTSTPA